MLFRRWRWPWNDSETLRSRQVYHSKPHKLPNWMFPLPSIVLELSSTQLRGTFSTNTRKLLISCWIHHFLRLCRPLKPVKIVRWTGRINLSKSGTNNMEDVYITCILYILIYFARRCALDMFALPIFALFQKPLLYFELRHSYPLLVAASRYIVYRRQGHRTSDYRIRENL